MTMILGINCNGSHAYFASVVDGNVEHDELARMGLSPSLARPDALLEFVEGLRAHMRRLHPAEIAMFGPNYRPNSYQQAARRAHLETLTELSAAMEGVGVYTVYLPTIRRLLNVQRGGTDELVVRVFPDPLGPYWNAGRSVAALVAWAVWMESHVTPAT